MKSWQQAITWINDNKVYCYKNVFPGLIELKLYVLNWIEKRKYLQEHL